MGILLYNAGISHMCFPSSEYRSNWLNRNSRRLHQLYLKVGGGVYVVYGLR